MRITKTIQLFLLVAACVGNTACVGPKSTEPYVIQEQGRSTWRVLFDKKMPTSEEQWIYARETQNRGQLKKADRRMLYLVRRWPNSKEAPWAQRARADMLYARGELKEAFKEYQFLIDNYSSRMRDYDSVLESQFNIAVDIMNQRRMRWIFGGYRAPEYAVNYFEDVIRNGPQWSRAQEAQFLIGKAYQEADDLELAISAYGILGYRYPDSTFAEEAAWLQIQCLDELRMEFPNSLDNLDNTRTATTVFLSTYSKSEHRDAIVLLRNRLYEVKAGKAFDEAAFYAKVPKKPASAIIYYEQMIAEYPKSKLVPIAQERIENLKALMALPGTVPRPVEPSNQATPPEEDPGHEPE
jgi:outer membrane protein assembly factor BamD (BamD/ComL family)